MGGGERCGRERGGRGGGGGMVLFDFIMRLRSR